MSLEWPVNYFKKQISRLAKIQTHIKINSFRTIFRKFLKIIHYKNL